LRVLLKLAYRLTTLLAGMASHGYKAKGFTFYLRDELNRRGNVLAGLYQRRLANKTYISRRDEHDPVLEDYLSEFDDLRRVANGHPMVTKRLTHQPKSETSEAVQQPKP
jgi:hypothetical protein